MSAGRVRALRARVDGWPAGLSAALVGLALFLVYVPTAAMTYQQSPDPIAAFVPAWEIANNRTVTLDAYEGMVPWFKEFDGRIVSDRAPGVVFFGVPFYWVFHPIGQSPVPAALAAASAAAGAMAALHLVFRRHASPSTATAAALLAGLGTATWTVSADGLWPHGPAQLWLALALLALPRRAWLAGAFLGLAVFTRPQTAVAAAVVGIALGWQARSLLPVLRIGTGSLLGAAGLVAYNTVVFGSASLTGGYEDLPARWVSQLTVPEYLLGVLGTLVSPDRGVLVLSPFLLVLFLGVPTAWRRIDGVGRAAALAGLAYILVYLLVNRFSGGENFYSYRLPIEALTLGAPLLLGAYVWWVRERAWALAAFPLLAALSVGLHAIGAVYHVPSYEVHGPWTGARIAEAFGAAGPWVVAATAMVVVTVGAIGSSRARRRLAADPRR